MPVERSAGVDEVDDARRPSRAPCSRRTRREPSRSSTSTAAPSQLRVGPGVVVEERDVLAGRGLRRPRLHPPAKPGVRARARAAAHVGVPRAIRSTLPSPDALSTTITSSRSAGQSSSRERRRGAAMRVVGAPVVDDDDGDDAGVSGWASSRLTGHRPAGRPPTCRRATRQPYSSRGSPNSTSKRRRGGACRTTCVRV